MPGRPDRPGSGSADRPGGDDRPGEAGRPRGPQDELRRRLASLPANHPSSPWYRERPARPATRLPAGSRPAESRRDQPEKPGQRGESGQRAEPGQRADPGPQAGAGRQAEAGQWAGGRAGRGERAGRGRSRSEESGFSREAPAGRSRPAAAGGDVTSAAGRAAPDAARRGPEQDRRGPDDALWQRAAAMHAASQARREARPKGTPVTPRDRREPYRPWFAGSGRDDGIWLGADGAGDPWFAEDGFLGHGR